MSFNMSSMKDNLSEIIPDMSNLELTRKNIELLSNYVRLVDSDQENGLDLFCYLNCKKTDPDFLKSCRGVVFNDKNLVLTSFPYTMEYTEKEHENVQNDIGSVFEKCLFYKSYEGCLIRIFNFNDKWYVSTNKKFDAFRSKWSSKNSYGEFFKEALKQQFLNNERLRDNINMSLLNEDMSNVIEVFCENLLDKDKQYMFLLLNNKENRIVCNEPDIPIVYHVGTFVEKNLTMDIDIFVPYPEKMEFTSLQEIYEYVSKIDYYKSQGVIVFAPNNKQYKILNEDYSYLYNIRGNEPSIKFRYLQLRMNSKDNKLLRTLYPNNIKDFEEYENLIYDATKLIYNAYVDRFIKKLYVTVPVEEFSVIKEAHNWYLQDRKNNKITYDKIIEILNNQPPTNLNKIIKRIKLNKNINTNDKVLEKPPQTQKRLLKK